MSLNEAGQNQNIKMIPTIQVANTQHINALKAPCGYQDILYKYTVQEGSPQLSALSTFILWQQ